MRSRYADEYNHDGAAPGYDEDVLNEEDPIRTGYRATLDWVIKVAQIGSDPGALVPRICAKYGGFGGPSSVEAIPLSLCSWSPSASAPA